MKTKIIDPKNVRDKLIINADGLIKWGHSLNMNGFIFDLNDEYHLISYDDLFDLLGIREKWEKAKNNLYSNITEGHSNTYFGGNILESCDVSEFTKIGE